MSSKVYLAYDTGFRCAVYGSPSHYQYGVRAKIVVNSDGTATLTEMCSDALISIENFSNNPRIRNRTNNGFEYGAFEYTGFSKFTERDLQNFSQPNITFEISHTGHKCQTDGGGLINSFVDRVQFSNQGDLIQLGNSCNDALAVYNAQDENIYTYDNTIYWRENIYRRNTPPID